MNEEQNEIVLYWNKLKKINKRLVSYLYEYCE